MADDDDQDDAAGSTGGDTDQDQTTADNGLNNPEGFSADTEESMLGLQQTPGESPVPTEAAAVQPPPPPPPAAAPAVQVTVNTGGKGGAQTTQTVAPAQAPASQGSSVSASHSGENFGTLAKLDAAAKDPEAALKGDLSYAAQAYQDSADRAERDAAATSDAEKRRAAALYQQQQVMAAGQAAIAKEHATWAEQEQIASDQVRVTTAHYVAQMESDVARVKAMKLNPRPQEGYSPGVRAGLAMSAFAQGFLAPKGIHIDSVGAINRMVDQQIRAQEEAIQRGEWLVGEDRELWQMARAGAADQAEARTRLRGLKLAGMQADIQSHASQVGADLALADGAVVQAKIQAALDDTKTALTSQFYTRAVDVHKSLLSAKLDRMRIAVETERISSAERIALARVNAKNEAATAYYSPFNGDAKGGPNGTPAQVGYWLPGTTDAQKTLVNEKMGKLARFEAASDAFLKDLQDIKGERVIGGRVTILDKEQVGKLKAARLQYATSLLNAFPPGERAGQALYDQIVSNNALLPTETGASWATAVKTVYQNRAQAFQQAQQGLVNYVGTPVRQPDGSVGWKPVDFGYGGIAGSNLTEGKLTAWPEPNRPGSLDVYIESIASPKNPKDRPDDQTLGAVDMVYKTVLGKGKDSDRALGALKTLADPKNIDDVNPFLSGKAEAYLLTLPLSKEDRAHYERGYKADQGRLDKIAREALPDVENQEHSSGILEAGQQFEAEHDAGE